MATRMHFGRAGLVVAVVGSALGAALSAGAGPAAADTTTDYGFVAGPSCDPATSVAKVIAETDTDRLVICRAVGVFPPDDHYISATKRKPVPFRYDDVGYGPQTYVVRIYEKKLLIGGGSVEIHDAAANTVYQKPLVVHRFEL